MKRSSSGLLLASVLAACAGASSPPAAAPAASPGPSAAAQATSASATPRDDYDMSDPAEYRLEHVSESAGEAIFARTGIGDPYRTGLPYPIFLALLDRYPDLFGATPQELAARFGFIARAADPKSPDPDLRAGLPLGMHLTEDPYTRVLFVMTSCSVCHSEVVRWPGGEKLVLGMGSRRIRIHAYDDAMEKAASRGDFDIAHLGPAATRMAETHDVSWSPDYREIVLKRTIGAMKERVTSRAKLLDATRDGLPGRVAPIESFAVALGQILHATCRSRARSGGPRSRTRSASPRSAR
jgi:hypothetical protein